MQEATKWLIVKSRFLGFFRFETRVGIRSIDVGDYSINVIKTVSSRRLVMKQLHMGV